MDKFALNTYAWEDDVDDLPLVYIFAYVSGSADESDVSGEVVLRAASESSEASDVYLPQVGNALSGRDRVSLKLQRCLGYFVVKNWSTLSGRESYLDDHATAVSSFSVNSGCYSIDLEDGRSVS